MNRGLYLQHGGVVLSTSCTCFAVCVDNISAGAEVIHRTAELKCH